MKKLPRPPLAALCLAAALLAGCGAAPAAPNSPAATPAPTATPIAAPAPTAPPTPAETPYVFDWTQVGMDSVDSSCFSEVGYDAAAAALVVRFVDSGAVYAYYDVPQAVYEALLAAPSIGRYYNQCIREQYAYELLEPAP